MNNERDHFGASYFFIDLSKIWPLIEVFQNAKQNSAILFSYSPNALWIENCCSIVIVRLLMLSFQCKNSVIKSQEPKKVVKKYVLLEPQG